MVRICPICKIEYEDSGNSWKTKCFECYKYWKYFKRIQTSNQMGRHNNFYFTHPSVTKEELDKWIRDNKLDAGWGVQKLEEGAPGWKKLTIWIDNTNFD